MKKFLLMAQYPTDAFRRQKWLTQEFPNAEITTCCNEKEAMWIVLSEQFDLAVLQVPSISSKEEHFGQLIRTSGFDFPLIISADMSNDKGVLERLPRRSNMIVLPEPLTRDRVIGVARKLLKSGKANQPAHQRFFSKQLVKIEMYGSGTAMTSKLVDISKGGAQLVIEDDLPKVETGDFVKLRFDLEEVNSVRKVSGQVVWHRPNHQTGQSFFGVEFLR